MNTGMLNDEKNVIDILNQYKRKQAESYLMLIPILDGGGSTIGFLRPITADFKTTMADCVELLDQWRLENPCMSPSRFPVTHERTERWVIELIINNDCLFYTFPSPPDRTRTRMPASSWKKKKT